MLLIVAAGCVYAVLLSATKSLPAARIADITTQAIGSLGSHTTAHLFLYGIGKGCQSGSAAELVHGANLKALLSFPPCQAACGSFEATLAAGLRSRSPK